jgi:FkbM family methyltransferase
MPSDPRSRDPCARRSQGLMPVTVDDSPFGSRAPGPLDRLVLALTRRLPPNRLGLRTAILLRRITLARLGQDGLDTEAFGLRLRLYPRGNGCEKGALFTPQMYERTERDVLERLAQVARGAGRPFRFIDVGANVGLFSLIMMRLAGGNAQALAIEPQPGLRERLVFNIAANPGLDVRPVGVAVADKESEVELFIDTRDLGGSRIGGRGTEGASVKVRARKLIDVVAEEGFSGADVLKIDVEGAEDVVLQSFLAEAAETALPGTILLADNRYMWSQDLFALLSSRGYREGERSVQNVFFHRSGG